ncbi:MAG: hypothetical protein COZ06_20105 [Armatimonadetes bacterium CG_4_10_14_3_um_filter_66_18]|nr:hypothetical protein [Armatimonadota bacterium]OIP05713.1 MAG: hypothetical protein AUJ96_10235 [Armatimonadetes bacterium CG2_30_66_41]PIU90769.1 MAG: hypothetical protein COS65_24145 [Armatimonadetes bacterium CG06_land_8_20_14_3_00_66_21]PIW13080.1 MAG: hypothetical protein COW34_11610 [Armatimonadetes bacterium CG17_big_fil_post_rev_8_21_14_2_50_66_6]PIX48012.1 MAG: hypothetical protein COZ57_06770 [Armatimonadetes bacterium CG_4_8_14_3_um_filter_66_20]PIY44636.1 MAG: hypothetical prote
MARYLRVAIILAGAVAVAAGQAWVNTSAQRSGQQSPSTYVRRTNKPVTTSGPVSFPRLAVEAGHDQMPFVAPREYGVVYFIQTPGNQRVSPETPVRFDRQIVRQGNAVVEFSERGVVVWGPAGARPAKGHGQLGARRPLR